ncbi:MAG: LysR family transcriptional regulator [Pseudomonadota bacterium]|nr:MAG: LysR family transcriptional regulator [Pseudomonadota bacterium]
MNLRDLKYLVAVAEHQHFGRAAQACFVSQPTLSTQLKKLEQTLGVTLIERTNRRVMLSPEGEQIVAQAQRILVEVNALTAMSEQLRDPMGGEVRLGIIPTVAPYLLPKILAPLAREFPNLHIQLTEGQTSQITRLLKHGDLDAVLLALPLQEENVEEFELYIEPFLFAAAAGHPKAQNHSVTTDDLQDEEVLLLEDGHCLRDQALAICQAHRGVESNSVSATSLETLRELVSANMGITLMPELAVASLGDRDTAVRYIPFAGEVPSRT